MFLDIAIRTLLFACLAGSDPGASSYVQQEYPVNNNPKWSKIYPWLSTIQLAEFFCIGKANTEGLWTLSNNMYPKNCYVLTENSVFAPEIKLILFL